MTSLNQPSHDHIRLDHIALAADSAFDNFNRYAGDLGGRLVGGGFDPGFYWGQVRFSGGMKIELLQPHKWEHFDFLRRFLDHSGPGPHHCTFTVPDIHAAIANVKADGYKVVGENFDNEHWKEAFIHPKSSHGIVVQLAQVPPGASDGVEAQTPPPRAGSQANLERIVHLVDDLEKPMLLFENLLDGKRTGEGETPEGQFIDLEWPVDGRIRFIKPTDPAMKAWLGERSGRNYCIEFSVEDPSAVAHAREISQGIYEVAPENNLGTRIVLTRS